HPITQPVDEIHRRRRAVLVPADRLQVEVALRRVDVLPSPLEVDGPDLGIAPELGDEPPDGGGHVRIVGPAASLRVDDEVGRRRRARTDGTRQRVEPADALEVPRYSLIRAGAELERQ